MSNDDRKSGGPGQFASPPCMAHEVDPGYFGLVTADPQQERDVTRWRRAERARLRTDRQALSVAERKAAAESLAIHLLAYLHDRLGGAPDPVLSAYWPIKGEPDLRALMAQLHESGVKIALPVVETRRAPLVFRYWTPQTRMIRGDWNILVPPPEAPAVKPDIVLAPLVGWDGEGYRLGYGGGYFDRTLAAPTPRPYAIGVGLQEARLETIYPQPHDIALDAIITEAGLQVVRGP